MAPLDWKKLVAQELKRRDATFPKWYFELPDAPEDVLDVTPLPEQAGILTEREIQITRTDGYGVVEKIRQKKWTCVEVTEAFCKRAMLAQKYVASSMRCDLIVDQLLDGTDVRPSHRTGKVPRLPTQTNWPSPRITPIRQGTSMD